MNVHYPGFIRMLLNLCRQFSFLLPIILLLLVLFFGVFQVSFVPTNSMAPDIPEGSFVISLRHSKEIQEEDIILFKHEKLLLIKRVAGKGPAEIKIGEKNYILPKDSYFVIGDNRKESIDSRSWNNPYIKEKEIKGKAIYCISKRGGAIKIHKL